MGNNSSRTDDYYNSIKQNPHYYDSVDITDMNPYEVFNLNDNFTWDELKTSYRRVAKLVHPDKGGSEILFKKITECFKHLASELKKKEIDKPHWELKKQSQQFFQDNPIPNNNYNHDNDTQNFSQRFNKAFDDNKLEDELMDGGYGDIMEKSNGKRDDINVPQFIKGKYNSQNFNKTFDAVTLTSSKDVIIYKEPEALDMSKQLKYTEIGANKPNDYSSAPTDNKLQYTDYLKAYSTSRLVDPRSVTTKNYKSIKDLENAREDAIKKQLSDDELKWISKKEKLEKQKEEERLRRLDNYDKRIAQHHERVNRIFIK